MPTRVDVIELILVLEVGTIDGELIIRVEFRLVLVFGGPRAGAFALNDEHTMVDSRAVIDAILLARLVSLVHELRVLRLPTISTSGEGESLRGSAVKMT